MKSAAAALAVALASFAASGADLRPDQAEFRALYKELVETNTTHSTGSCTEAAAKMAARLRAAGFADSDLVPFSAPEFPKDGGLVATLKGESTKAMLLLAHLDVVEAKREDWVRDPMVLNEEGGKFYGRGTMDDKAQAAIWTDMLVNFRKQGYKPKRTIKMALTCGEESGANFNGAKWLAENRRDLIAADFALNEGGGGELDAEGKPVSLTIEAAEKIPRNFRLEVTNPGGHSSRPVPDNAIYHLAHALTAVETTRFPIQFIDANRAYFTGIAKSLEAKGKKEMAGKIRAMLKEPLDQKAGEAVAALDPSWNTTLRTTCVATLLEGGHALNALPQRASANINCRIFPGMPIETVRATLEKAIADSKVKVTLAGGSDKSGSMPPLTAAITGPVEKLAAEFFPGVPVMPTLVAGATDGSHLAAAGIPTYGIDGLFADPQLNNIHGLNEYVDAAGLYRDRDFLTRLVRTYAEML